MTEPTNSTPFEGGFDPFAQEYDYDLPIFADESPYDPGVNPNPVTEVTPDVRPAAVRLEELFVRMGAQRPTLLGVLALCATPQATEAVHAEVERLQQGNASVFNAGTICALLERAGGLTRTDAEGNPYVEPTEEDMQVIEEDGVQYYAPVEVASPYWCTTEEGAAVVAADDPAARLAATLEEDAAFVDVYKRILEAASAEEGVAVAKLIAELDHDLMKLKPRRSVTRFVERLQLAGALEWKGAWHATQLGKDTLATL